MTSPMKKRETRKVSPHTKTRATPAFAELRPIQQAPEQTEVEVPANVWETGIDYASVSIPDSPVLQDSSDRLEILELLDD